MYLYSSFINFTDIFWNPMYFKQNMKKRKLKYHNLFLVTSFESIYVICHIDIEKKLN